MKSLWSYTAGLALAVGLLGTAAQAQAIQPRNEAAAIQYGTFNPGQSGLLQQAGWGDHRRCDGDHDRDDRGCYNQGRYNNGRYNNGYYPYGNSGYYGNYGYGSPYYGSSPYYGNARNNGWYDNQGRWHAYKNNHKWRRDRDDDDDRR